MKNRITRRTFILGAVGITLTTMGSFFVIKKGYFITQHHVEKTILTVLEKHLWFLKLEKSNLSTFTKDFISDSKNKGILIVAKKLSFLRLLYKYTSFVDYIPRLNNHTKKLEELIISKFLLSTDFFWNGADENHFITYLSYYDPYTKPCQNPFTHLS